MRGYCTFPSFEQKKLKSGQLGSPSLHLDSVLKFLCLPDTKHLNKNSTEWLCHGQLLLTFLQFLANIGKQGKQLRQPVEICCATNRATLGAFLWWKEVAWLGALFAAMPCTNAKLLINAYARRAGDAVLLKWCHLPKIEVHLPPKELPNSFESCWSTAKWESPICCFCCCKCPKNFFKAFSYLVAVGGWITKSASFPNPLRLLIRSCLSTASTILRFPIFVSQVFGSACRPDFGKILRMTRPGVPGKQSGGEAIFLQKPTAVYGLTTGLCWEFEVKPLSLPNGGTCSWRLSVGIYAHFRDVQMALISSLFMCWGPCGLTGHRQLQTTFHLHNFWGILCRKRWLVGTVSVVDLSNTSVPLVETRWHNLETKFCSLIRSRPLWKKRFSCCKSRSK